MANLFEDVQPGDLIMANLMNQVLAKLKSLEDRVAALETAGSDAVVIHQVLPPGSVRIGQELRVLGRNFGVLTGSAVVFIDDVPVTAYKAGSNNETLIFNIPDVPNVPLGGRSAVLTVGNRTSSVTRTITLLPAQPLQGAVDVIWLGVEPTTLTPNNPATFRFRLRSRTNLDATYTISPVVSVADNLQEWQNNLQVLDNVQNLITSRMILLAAGQEKVFHVRINPIPAVPNNTPFTLTVNASADAVTGTSGPIHVTLNVPIELPDLNVSLSFEAADFNPVDSGSIEHGATEDTIRLQSNGTAQITLLAGFSAAGTYDVLVAAASPQTTTWNLRRHPQATPAQYTITEADLQNPQHKHNETPKFLISPLANASATGEVEFKIQRVGTTTSRTLRMKLALIP